jgi:cell division protein FtsA
MTSDKIRLAVGLDAGSSKTRCVISTLENGQLRYRGHGETDGSGWSRGRLADQHALAESMRRAVQEAESRAHLLVDACTVGVGGTTVQGGYCRGVYEFGRPREIQQDDLEYAVERATRVRLEHDRILLHVFPQDFVLDGRAGYRNPRRATAARLEANVHAITASAHEHEALVDAVHQAHLAVEETVFEPVAGAFAAILQEDRTRGVALLDIGTHSSDLVLYDGEAMMLATSLPVWADHFTRDIAYVFKISYEDAERLKQEYGCAMLGLTADNSLIEVPSAEGRPAREARRLELNEILEARAEELFHYVKQEIQKVGMEQNLLEGLVISGGGSLLNGMCDMAERILNCPARNGLTIGIRDWPPELDTPEWTVAAGLSMYSAKLKTRKDTRRRAPGLVGMVLR